MVNSGDTGVCDALEAVAVNADMFICEATFCSGSSAEEKHHLSAKTAAMKATAVRVKRLLLTHFHSEQQEKIYEEACQYCDNVETTRIGETYFAV